jgi:hypothetical protein
MMARSGVLLALLVPRRTVRMFLCWFRPVFVALAVPMALDE